MKPMATVAPYALGKLVAIASGGRVAWQRSCPYPRIVGWQFDRDVRRGVVPVGHASTASGIVPLEKTASLSARRDHEPRAAGGPGLCG